MDEIEEIELREESGQNEAPPFDPYHYQEQMGGVIGPMAIRFDHVVQSYPFFNLVFLALIVGECSLFGIFFTFLTDSSLVAFSLAGIVLTVFAYFTLRLYWLSRKPEHFIGLRNEFIDTCKQVVHYQEGIPEHHLALANSLCKFASHLQEREYTYYAPPAFLKPLCTMMETVSCWWHWEDVHSMREGLLQQAIDEHLKLVKCEPTNLEVHVALANAYVLLSTLFVDPHKQEGHDDERWVHPKRTSETFQAKFRATAERAIEEFKILNDYAPNDPWVHAQLAYSYHDLQMPQEEIREYETILKLRPNDHDTLFKLGVLYFQQGLNAKGLRIYEQLRRSHYKRAENLIKFYGAYTNPDPVDDESE
jgi:tetratricopeptide (TPR) repeat protein